VAELAVVTGASAGIGRETALALAAAGLDVLTVARRADALAADAGVGIQAVPADVTTAAGRARIREIVGDRRIAALVHGAGVFPRGRITKLASSEWDAAIATNVRARLDLVLELRGSLHGGRVLFVGSDAAKNARRGGAAYSVSKAASEMLWRCLGVELGDEIAFGMAKPGLVETAMLEDSLAAPREDFPAGEVYAAMRERGETIAAATVARFFRFLLLETTREEFAADLWDIRDGTHHSRLLDHPLYVPPRPT
jgi:NAD(P)-dependent dehydrogenase (short-subunit alcohol dehydrogenase family)